MLVTVVQLTAVTTVTAWMHENNTKTE